MDMRACRLFMQKVQAKLSMCVCVCVSLCDVVMMGMYEEFKKRKKEDILSSKDDVVVIFIRYVGKKHTQKRVESSDLSKDKACSLL